MIDKVYKDLVAEEAKNAKDGKVSQAKKNELYEQVVAAMDKGYIATDTIDEVLGGEDFKAYQAAQDKENAVLKELEGLYQGEELAAQQQGIRDNSTLSQLRQTMGDKVAELVKGDRLAESYRERERRSQLFQADVSRYQGKAREIVQKAIDSGVLNNTNRSHELVDLIAKVGSDKDLDFDFINNEKLKESGFALNGKTVNGFLSDSGVTVNINSAKALNSVVGHEITHVLEGTGEFYTALESMVTEIAKTKGEYNARLTELRSLYADVEGYKGADGHEKIKKELVADLVGDYIFTDTDFINRLSTENRNVFEKIYDEIQYLCRVATASSKEARQLEKAKKAFEDAYRQDVKNTADDGGVRYSMSQHVAGQITADMTDAQRAEILQNKKLTSPVYAGEADISIANESDLESGRSGLVKAALVRIGEEFDVFTDYDIEDVDVQITLSRGNLRESVTKEANPVQLAKLLPILKETVESAVGIESHANRYYYDNTTESFGNLLGGYIDGEYFVPVRFGLKHIKGGETVLYVVVDQQKIKAEVLKTTTQQNDGSAVSRSAFTYNVPQLVSLVNSKDLLRYLPDDMLSTEQKKIKQEGIAETIKYTNDKNDAKYAKFIASGNNHAVQAMVDAAAKAAGYTIKAYHGTTNKEEHSTWNAERRTWDTTYTPITVFKRQYDEQAGHFFSADENNAGGYGSYLYSVYLMMKKPLVIECNGQSYNNISFDGKEMDTYEWADYARKHRYDGVIFRNVRDGAEYADMAEPTTDYVVFDSNRIKSADPVTYDNDGRVIPISERFKATKKDIRYSLSSQEDMFPVRKDLDAVRRNIYGSDVELRELGPVRKDLQTEEAAQDPYDDLPFDMPENLEEGQLSDAELEEDARRNPITTVAERLEVKFASLRQELQTNEQNRKASADAYDQRIAELQQRYDAKPKKHTKAANAILRQIAKQEQLKAQRDAEFEKRINDIKKKIDKTREQMQMDHTREDLLEKQLRQVDEKLEADKQALEDEFRERRAEAERVADRASYFSGEARILLDEILYHKKGTGFSEDIRELLSHGHSFKEIKDALRTVEQYPEGMKHPNWLDLLGGPDHTKFSDGSVPDVALHPSAVSGEDGLDAFYAF